MGLRDKHSCRPLEKQTCVKPPGLTLTRSTHTANLSTVCVREILKSLFGSVALRFFALRCVALLCLAPPLLLSLRYRIHILLAGLSVHNPYTYQEARVSIRADSGRRLCRSIAASRIRREEREKAPYRIACSACFFLLGLLGLPGSDPSPLTLRCLRALHCVRCLACVALLAVLVSLCLRCVACLALLAYVRALPACLLTVLCCACFAVLALRCLRYVTYC